MGRIKLLLVLLLISGFVQGQGNRTRLAYRFGELVSVPIVIPGYTNFSTRNKYLALAVDSGIHVRQYNGVPVGVPVGVWTADGLIGMDTTTGYFYGYQNGVWIKQAKFSDVGSGLTGSGTANQVTYWTGASAIGGVGPGTTSQILIGGTPPSFSSTLPAGMSLKDSLALVGYFVRLKDSVTTAYYNGWVRGSTDRVEPTRHVQYSGTGNAYFFGNSVVAGSLTTSKFTTIVSNKMGWTEVNLGVNGRTLENQYPNLAFGASSFTQSLSTIPAKGANDKILVFSIGDNDMAASTFAGSTYTTANFKLAYDTVISNALYKGWANNEILICGPSWITQTGFNTYGATTGTAPTQATANSFLQATKEVAIKWNTLFVDEWYSMRNNGDSTMLNMDGVHPLAYGDTLMANAIYNYLTPGTLKQNEFSVANTAAAGYLTKSTGKYALGQSVVYDNGTGIGIGTTSPATQIHLYQSDVNGGNQLRFQNNSATGSLKYSSFAQLGSTGFGITDWPSALIIEGLADGGIAMSAYGGTFKIQTGTSRLTRMTVDGSGSVGIGTSTPTAKTDILSTTEQLRLLYDASNYMKFTVGSGGAATIVPTGNVINWGGGTTATETRFLEPSGAGTNYVGFKSPATLAGNTTYTYPNAYPAVTGYILSSTDAGVMSWIAPSAGGSSLFPTTGTGTATGDVTGAIAGHDFNINSTTYPDNLLFISDNGRVYLGDVLADVNGTGIAIDDGSTAIVYSAGVGGHTFTGSTTMGDLAGTGTRAVLASSTGLLSAPVSDRSTKTKIKPLETGIATLMKLKPVSFQYKDEYKEQFGKGTQIGFIAQDIAQVLPGSTYYNTAGLTKGKMGYNETDLIPVLVKSLQEAVERIVLLEKEIKKLKHK